MSNDQESEQNAKVNAKKWLKANLNAKKEDMKNRKEQMRQDPQNFEFPEDFTKLPNLPERYPD